MPRSLPALENQRAQIQQRIAQLGDMRAGSISTTGGRRGNPRCHGRQPNDRGHGPYLRLTRQLDAQTVTESLASPAVRQKAGRPQGAKRPVLGEDPLAFGATMHVKARL